MKNKASIGNKIYRKLHWIVFNKLDGKKWATPFYASWRHAYTLKGKQRQKSESYSSKHPNDGLSHIFLTQIPNEGAGIGHQLANYNAGLYFASFFGVKYAYPGFRKKDWESFLGLGENEVSLKELRKKGYKVLRLPYYEDAADYEMVRNIIASYSGQRVVFLNELDQFYKEQYGVAEYAKKKFNSAMARSKDKLIYDEKQLNIAVHVRRGDINVVSSADSNLKKRWLDNDYYENVLENAIKRISEDDRFVSLTGKKDCRPSIYIFSQGSESDFESFKRFEKDGDLHFCLDMEEKASFLHMVRADILITSRSSFSYKPALISDGIRICPPGFWHDYPENEHWFVADEHGNF